MPRDVLAALGLSVTAALVLIASASDAQQVRGAVTDAAISNEADGANWLAYGRNHSEQRFSPLDQINVDTVDDLAPAMFLDLPEDKGGMVSTPLVADGVMYFVGSLNRIRSVDAATGELLWTYDPQVARHSGNDLRAGWSHNRGIALWDDKVYLATWDGRLIALEQDTGEEVWSVRTFPPDAPLFISGAPKAFDGKIVIGNGGSEVGPSRGYVTAYDAETGEQIWRFYVAPGNPADGFESDAMRMAAETWTGEWWRFGGGGNVWHGVTYDAELHQLYIGTGNGSPWNQKIRSPGGGDNLFLCSIVALDPDTGAYLWHYQTTPGETWDYNSTMDIVLADLEIEGRAVKAILHAPKNGFFYVIDRETGELLSAEPFAETTWATHVDLETGRPVEVPGARYENGAARIAPGPQGAHSWHAMSYNPQTGLAYIPTIHQSFLYTDELVDIDTWQPIRFEGDGQGVMALDPQRMGEAPGTLQAWDPVRGEAAWEVALPDLWNSGTLTTAGGLVFQGRASGELVAHDAETGDVLWIHDLGLGVSAPPITYSIGGVQYVAVLVGWGGGPAALGGPDEVALGWSYGAQPRRLVAFSLGGDAELPSMPPPLIPEPIALPDFAVEQDLAARGEVEYARCIICHGLGAVSAGMAPDLRASAVVGSADVFANVVRDGLLMDNGMPAFQHLADEQLAAIRHYIRGQAERDLLGVGGGGD